MDKNEFKSMVERYKNELLRISKFRSKTKDNQKFQKNVLKTKNDQRDLLERKVRGDQTEETISVFSATTPSTEKNGGSSSLNDNVDPTTYMTETEQNAQENIPASSQGDFIQTGNAFQGQGTPTPNPGGTPADQLVDGMRLQNTPQVGLPQNNISDRSEVLPFEKGAPYTGNAAYDNIANDTYREFLDKNDEYGFLKIQAYIARQAVPVKGVKITVSKKFTDTEKVFFEGVTDESGIIDNIQLPAPSKFLSEQPEDVLPYAAYDFYASDGSSNKTVNADNVQIFQGIKTIQPVIIIPV